MQETRVQSLDREDPLEKEVATQSHILAWKIPGTEEPGRLQSMGSQDTTWQLKQQNILSDKMHSGYLAFNELQI